MRVVKWISTILALSLSVPVFAQSFSWTEYVSRDDYFSVSFPGNPTIEQITYPTEYRITLPGRVYSHEDGPYRYSVTVVDYEDAIDIHLARNESCRTDGGDGDLCQDDGAEEMRGALIFASWNIMNREGADVNHFAHYNSDRVEGLNVRLINADESRTSAIVHMHEDRLYILEATVPRGAPAPGLFQISLGFLDENYQRIRYNWVDTQLYINGYPTPSRLR